MKFTDFDQIIAPITCDVFMKEYFEKKHLVISRDVPGFFDGLLSLGDVDHVISTMGLRPPELKVTAGKSAGTDSDRDSDQAAPEIAQEGGIADPVRVAQAFADGGTIILSGLHDRLAQLGQYTRVLEAALSCRVQTNIYLTPGGYQGFKPHYDSHDVLVLQIEGSKEWRIYDSPVALPLPSQAFQKGMEIGPETDRFVLHPGDVAYIPRGLAHDAVATDETSLHITTGLMFRTWADLVAEAVTLMAEKSPALRHAIPPGFANGPARAHGEYLRGLLSELAETAPCEGLVERFQSDFVDSRVARVTGQLAQQRRADGLSLTDTMERRPGLIYQLGATETEGQLRLSAHGSDILLPDHVETCLKFALSQPRLTPADLPNDLDDEGKLVLMKRLIREGLFFLP